MSKLKKNCMLLHPCHVYLKSINPCIQWNGWHPLVGKSDRMQTCYRISWGHVSKWFQVKQTWRKTAIFLGDNHRRIPNRSSSKSDVDNLGNPCSCSHHPEGIYVPWELCDSNDDINVRAHHCRITKQKPKPMEKSCQSIAKLHSHSGVIDAFFVCI